LTGRHRLALVTLVAPVFAHGAARGEPPVTVDLAVVADATRYDANGFVSGDQYKAAAVFGSAIRARFGVKLDQRYSAFVRASVSNERDVSYSYLDDLGLPTESGTVFRVYTLGAGVETMLDERLSVAGWLGAVRLDFFHGDDHDTGLGVGIDVGYDLAIFAPHRIALTVGASYGITGMSAIQLGLAYRLR
jgi:hypothetical protein